MTRKTHLKINLVLSSTVFLVSLGIIAYYGPSISSVLNVITGACVLYVAVSLYRQQVG